MDFLRSKQSGIQRDFTGALADAPEVFALDEIVKFGLTSTVSTLTYDPVQSLLAVGTYQNAGVSGKVHVFGQKRVHITFKLPRKASVKTLQLCDSRIVVLDSKNDVTIFNLQAPTAPGVGYSPPGVVTALRTDPCLDWAFLGLQTGEVVAYDLDREMLSPLRIPNLWRERAPKARTLPVVSLALHPKDVGTLLIGYSEGAVIYSFKQNTVVHYLDFQIPPGAPGADTELAMIRTLRKPAVTQALWHPTGTFVCTTHEDSVMVFWNPRDGSIAQTRTLEDAGVHLPGELPGASSDTDGISIRQPIFKLAWCSTSNPDDTSLLIAGGDPMDRRRAKGMTHIDLGPTPNMLTSSAQVVAEHFASPRRQRILPTPTEHDVVDFCLIPKTTPHYGGGHDPVAVIALLASGELVVLRFPDGQPLSPAGILNPSLALAHPFATRIDVAAVNRQRWLSLVRPRQAARELIVGGAECGKPLRRYENRTIILSSHPNGTVRIWDVGHADDVENDVVHELDVAWVLRREVDLKIECVSMAGHTAETAVGMETGEVVVFQWGKNIFFGRKPVEEAKQPTEGVRDARMWADPEVKEGFVPACVLDQKCGAVMAVKMSDIGFCAVAYQTGHICVLDMRGPAIIYHATVASLSRESKRTSFRKSTAYPPTTEKGTCLEFGVLTLEGDEFSSIALFVGTSLGRVLSFKILPSSTGTFTVVAAGATTLDDTSTPIVSITPVNSETGERAWAAPQAVASLREGVKTPGVVVAVSQGEARIFRPPMARGAHRSLRGEDGEGGVVRAAAVCALQDYGVCLSVVHEGGRVGSFSLPGLKGIGGVSARGVVVGSGSGVGQGTGSAGGAGGIGGERGGPVVLESGHILLWSGENEVTLIYQWGKGTRLWEALIDTLYNPDTPPLPRPVISNLQWLAGTQFLSIPELDLLVGGPERPESWRRQVEERNQRAAEKAAAAGVVGGPGVGGSGGGGGGGGEGAFAGMARSMRERTEKLTFTTDTMDRLEETSASFAEDVQKFVGQQKRKALLGGITGKWF